MHLKSIFMAGTSWKVIQVKMKFTLLTFVRSGEDDSLGLVPLNISLFVHLLWGFPKRFILLGRTLVSNQGLRSNVTVQVFAPHTYDYEMNILIIKHEKSASINLDMHANKYMNRGNIEWKGLINYELTCMNFLHEKGLL